MGTRQEWTFAEYALANLAMTDVRGEELINRLAQPGDAIAVLVDDFTRYLDHWLDGDWGTLRSGWLGLTNGAYVMWIGQGEYLQVDVSSRRFLDTECLELREELAPGQEQAILRAGFHPPEGIERDFWRRIEVPDEIEPAAFGIVEVLTTAFGVYAP